MIDIFIGYRRDDGGYARALYEKLLDWFDAGQLFFDHESLAPDAKFRPELDQAAQDCTVFLAVIGPHWLSDKNRERLQDPDDITRSEIRAALQHSKPLIPVLAGGAGFPPASVLPDDIRRMNASNAHHQLEAQYQLSFHKLLATLEKNHGLKPRHRRRDGSQAPFHLIDLPPARYFTDPAGHLPELRRILETQSAAAFVAAATVHGMGGVGKTQLALEYSAVYRAEYTGVWWFRAENVALIKLDYQEMRDALGIPMLDGESPYKTVKRWLQTQPRWLLVYDNAENKSDVTQYLPNDGCHHLLITSRDHSWSEVVLALDVWDENQALIFLRRRLENADDNERRWLFRILGGLPLALEQACAYILEQRVGVELYERDVENWQRANPLLDHKDAADYPYFVLTTLSLAFDKLDEPARQLLRLCAWFAPEPIPESLFRDHADLLPEALKRAATNDRDWNEIVARLESHALIQRACPPGYSEEMSLTLHRLTLEAVRAKLADKAADCATAVTLLRSAYPDNPEHPNNWPTCAALLPHARRLLDFHPHGWVPARPLSWLLERAATYLQYGVAQYREAVALFHAALEINRKELGEEHLDTLSTMSNLAVALQAQGDLPGAQDLQEKTLDIRRRVLGKEHPGTLTAMNNLASMLHAQGDLPGMQDLKEKALEIRRRVLGEEHPDTLMSMNNLAMMLRTQGDLPGARDLQEKALDIRRRVQGEEHPDTLTSMSNLALTLWSQGDLPGARDLQEKTLDIRRRVLGDEHPDTLTAMGNLAATLQAQGDLPGARDLEEKTLDIRRRVLDEEHPDTLISMGNLAATLQALGDLPGARDLQEKALDIYRRVLGGEHLNTLAAMNNLARICLTQNDTTRARALQEEMRDIRRRVSGERHKDTTADTWSLLMTLAKIGDLAAAARLVRDDLLWLREADESELDQSQQTLREKMRRLQAALVAQA